MSMSAKELLKFIGPVESGSKWEFCAEHQSTILRALSLLAAVLSSQDDVVCELRSDAAFLKRIGHPEEAETMDNAAARITLDAQEKAALKGELASVKAHADAMAEALDYGENFGAYSDLTDAYRAAHPKEGA